MSDPNLITSGLSRRVTVEGHKLSIEIYKLEHGKGWTLEIVDEEGTSFVWDDLFASDQAAIDEALNIIEKEGLSAFRDTSNVIPFPKK